LVPHWPLAIGAKAAIEFESAFAGVRKTVDTSEAGFARLARGLRDLALEIPISVGELARIAELGGQLGLPAEAITEFTEVIAKLGVTTNLEIEEAATGLARFANVMGTSTDDFDMLGAAIVDLGNNAATTETEILTFATRLSGIGSTIGASEGDILGLATAFSSLGVPAERGATAIQRAFIAMLQAVEGGGEKLRVFAEVAGFTADEFARLFRDDPVEAFIAFERGLGGIISEGGAATKILKDLGLGSQRTIDTLLKGANAPQRLADNVARGNRAMQEATALNEEAEKRFATTESAVKLAANAFKDLGIEIGNSVLPGITEFAHIMGGFADVLKENKEVLEGFAKIMVGIFAARLLGKMISGMGSWLIMGGQLTKMIIGKGKATKAFGTAANALVRPGGFFASLGKFAGGAAALGVGILAVVAAIRSIDRARAKQHAAQIDNLTDAIIGLRNGSVEAEEAYLAFVEATKQSSGIGDPSLDLEAQDVRRFVLDIAGQSTRSLVNLAISDWDAFKRTTGEVTEGLMDQAAAFETASAAEKLRARGFGVGVIPRGIPAELMGAQKNLERWLFILSEIEQQSKATRVEEQLRQDEMAATPGEVVGFLDPDALQEQISKILREGNVSGIPGIISEELQEGLDALLDP
jgi:TP901 family phage tail tape measure protein